MSTANRPQNHFTIGSVRLTEGGIALDQLLNPTLMDHRGVLGMPAYAITAESATSGAFWYVFSEPVATVQSWLALTAGAPVHVGDMVCASATMAHYDDSSGTPTVTVTNSNQDVVCSGVGRTVRVGRSTAELRALDRATMATRSHPIPEPPAVDTTVSAIDPGWDGPRILGALGRGELARGPLAELLAIRVTATDELVVTVEPQPWMANVLGAIQGGVIASIIGEVCSLAGQAHTGPGDTYTLADLSVYYFRSPPVDDRTLTVTSTTDRVGRRIATISATMTDHGGTEYVRAVANVAYDRAAAF